MGADLGLEPGFVGASRRALVDGLLQFFDTSAAGPRWVSLEAPAGAGKTRILRELYSRLAAERQQDPAYWPPDILTAAEGPVDQVAWRRKRPANRSARSRSWNP